MINRGTLAYAPYIMMLIKDRFSEEQDWSLTCTKIHKVKKPYKIEPKEKKAPATSSFMQDARASGGRATRTLHVSLPKEIKKLTWYEKYVLCRKLDLHKENYQGYRERRALFIQNTKNLHILEKKPGSPESPKAPIAYPL